MPEQTTAKNMASGLVRYFKALADETRLSIVRYLLEQELCVCEIMDLLKMSQPAVSHHLRILKQAGVVKDRRDGKWIYYAIDNDNMQEYNLSYIDLLALPLQELAREGLPERGEFPLCAQLEQENAACEP